MLVWYTAYADSTLTTSPHVLGVGVHIALPGFFKHRIDSSFLQGILHYISIDNADSGRRILTVKQSLYCLKSPSHSSVVELPLRYSEPAWAATRRKETHLEAYSRYTISRSRNHSACARVILVSILRTEAALTLWLRYIQERARPTSQVGSTEGSTTVNLLPRDSLKLEVIPR